jgi:hypothetical protein
MQFFLYEIVARIVAIYLCVYSIRKVRSGLVERKITYFLYGTDFSRLASSGQVALGCS